MRLLHILDSIRYSGAEIMLKIAAPYFKKEGIELHVLAIDYELGEFAGQLAEAGYIIHHKPLRKRIAYLLDQKLWFEEMKFDAIHIHPEKSFLVQAVACHLASIKTIRTIHTRFGFSGALKFRKKIERLIARSIGVKMVAISDSVRLHEKKAFGNECTTIYNWTDEQRFYPAKEEKKKLKKEFGFRLNDKVVLTVGSCQDVKRHEHILKAFSLIKSPLIKYLQVGSGPNFQEEQALAKRLNIQDKVVFIPFLNEPEAAYQIADLFVMTSKYEGLGVAPIEAMHCGVMPLMYNVSGLSELLTNKNGEIVKDVGELIEEKPEVLAERIVYWMNQDDRRIANGINVNAWVRSKFDRKRSLDEYIKLYKK